MQDTTYSMQLQNASGYFARHGFALIPLKAKSKAALENGWPDNASTDATQWEVWRAAGLNLGIHAGASRLIIVDLDTTREGGRDGAWQRYAGWCSAHGLPAYAPHCSTARQGMHVYFRVPEGVDIGALKGSDLAEGINVLVGRRYSVAPGSYYDGSVKTPPEESGAYALFADAPAPHDAPAALIAHCTPSRTSESGTSRPGRYCKDSVTAMLRWMADADAFADYDDWIRAGFVLRSEYGDDGLELWQVTHNATVTEDAEATHWRSFADEPIAGGVGIGTLMKRAHGMGWTGQLRDSAAYMFRDVLAAVERGEIPSPPIAPLGPLPLYELSIVTRPAYKESDISAADEPAEADDELTDDEKIAAGWTLQNGVLVPPPQTITRAMHWSSRWR